MSKRGVADGDGLRARWQIRSASGAVACSCASLLYEYARGYTCASSDGADAELFAATSALLFLAVFIVSTVRWTLERFTSDPDVLLSVHSVTSLEFLDAQWFVVFMEATQVGANGMLLASLAAAYEMRMVCGAYEEGMIAHALVYLYGVHVFSSCVSHVKWRSGEFSHGMAGHLPTVYYFVAFGLVVSSIVMASAGGESTGEADPLTTNTMYIALVSLLFGPFMVFVARMDFFKLFASYANERARRDVVTCIGGFLCAFGASTILFVMLFGVTGDREVLPYATTSYTVVLLFVALGVLTSMPFADLAGFNRGKSGKAGLLSNAAFPNDAPPAYQQIAM